MNKLKENTKNEASNNVIKASSIIASDKKGMEEDDDDYLKLSSECSCLKHIVNLLDDVFEMNLSNTQINCIHCSKEPSTITMGIFDITNIEYEKQPKRSRKFRNLVSSLKRHLKSEIHIQNVKSENLELKKKLKGM